MGILFFESETYGKFSHHSLGVPVSPVELLSWGHLWDDYGSRNPWMSRPFCITSFQNLRESMWMRCLTFGFNVAFFLLEKNKKKRLAWTFSSTSLHMSELYWHTGIVIKSCGKQDQAASVERGKEMRNLFGVQKELNLGYKHQWALANDMKAVPSRRIHLVFQCSSCMSAFAPTLIFIN